RGSRRRGDPLLHRSAGAESHLAPRRSPGRTRTVKSLRLLMAEDSEDDAELILRELRRGGFEVSWQRVQTAQDMRDALARQPWDIILSDFSMPEFSAPGALAVRRASGLD